MRRLLGVLLLLAAAGGLAFSIVQLVVLPPRTGFVGPGEFVLMADPATYTVYFDVNLADSDDPVPSVPFGLDCSVTTIEGTPLDLLPASAGTTKVGSRGTREIVRFAVETGGRYRIACGFPPGQEERVELSVGRAGRGLPRPIAIASGVTFLVGLVLVSGGRRRRRRQAVVQLPPPAQPGGPTVYT